MRAFVEQTEEELEYLEAQIQVVESLIFDRESSIWYGEDQPLNLLLIFYPEVNDSNISKSRH